MPSPRMGRPRKNLRRWNTGWVCCSWITPRTKSAKACYSALKSQFNQVRSLSWQ